MQVARAPSERRPEGDEQIPRRKRRKHRRRREVARQADHELRQPSASEPSSDGEDRHQVLSRGDHGGECIRSSLTRSPAGVRGPSHSETQGPRDVVPRGDVEQCTSPGTYPRSGSKYDVAGRKRIDNESRAESSKAKACSPEIQQIGSRQRGRPAGECSRESSNGRGSGALASVSPTSSSRQGKFRRKEDRGRSRSARGRKGKEKGKGPYPGEKGTGPHGAVPKGKESRKGGRKGKAGVSSKGEGKTMVEQAEGEKKGEEEVQKPDSTPKDRSDCESEAEINWDSALSVWLADYPADHLSAAQAGCHLLIQMYKSSGELSEYMDRCLHGYPPEGEERVRNLLPLPFWPDVLDEMREIVNEESFTAKGLKQRPEGSARSKSSKNLRLKGLLAWHGLVVLSINFNAEGCRGAGKVPVRGGKASPSQESALNRIWIAVRRFVDQKESGKGLGVPRTPSGPSVNWGQELEQLKVSYTGDGADPTRVAQG